MLVIALKNSREMLNMLNKVLRFDDNANFLVNGGLNENVNEEGNEMEKVEGEIDDSTVTKYLKELEEEKKKEKAKHEEEENQKGTTLTSQARISPFLLWKITPTCACTSAAYSKRSIMYFWQKNGKVGLYKTRTEMPDFILTDVTMPVMDGITMIREIKQDPYHLAYTYYHPLGKSQCGRPVEGIRTGSGWLSYETILYLLPDRTYRGCHQQTQGYADRHSQDDEAERKSWICWKD